MRKKLMRVKIMIIALIELSGMCAEKLTTRICFLVLDAQKMENIYVYSKHFLLKHCKSNKTLNENGIYRHW